MKDRDAGARLPVLGLKCEKPLGRTCFFAIVDPFGTAGIVYRADEMFNSFLAQEAASTSCADGGEYERFDLMKNYKGMEPWIGIMLLESRDDLLLTLIARRFR